MNWPFPSSPGPLYQNEVKCSAFDMHMIFHFHATQNSFSHERLSTWPHFETKGFWNSEVAYSSFPLYFSVGNFDMLSNEGFLLSKRKDFTVHSQ